MICGKRNVTGMLILAGMLAGCETGPHSSKDAPGVSLLNDSRVVIDSMAVQLDHGSLDITGAVHLKPGSTGPLSGRVDIEFVSPEGEVLDGLPVLIVPHEVTSSKPSTFHTLYGYIPPKGSFIRIHFVDADTQAREDLEGGFFDAGLDATGGGTGGGARAAGGTGTGMHGGNHRGYGQGGGFGSSFGAMNFGIGGGGTTGGKR